MTTPTAKASADTSSLAGGTRPGGGSHLFGMQLPGPVLVAVVALIMLTGTLISTALDSANDAVGVGSRLTARLTFVFFIAAYLARPLWQRFRWAPARWALANRRWLGLAAALSHSVHLAYVVAQQSASSESNDAVTLIFGGLGFFLFWALGITSNDSSTRALGKKWRWLHRGGIHYLWLIFLVTYAGAATLSPWLWVFVVLLVGGAGLRVANHLSRNSGVQL